MAKKKMLTTYEALSVLKGRGYTVAYSTLARWLSIGAIPGAEVDTSHPRGAIWRIPEASIKKFEPPKKGRPAAKKGAKK
jgi:hypothetical protein